MNIKEKIFGLVIAVLCIATVVFQIKNIKREPLTVVDEKNVIVLEKSQSVSAENVGEEWIPFCEYSLVNIEPTTQAFITPRYSVNGAYLADELQEYLYWELSSFGIEWMFELALCELYQESGFRSDVVNTNGLDMGIAQLRITYFDGLATESGLSNANVFDPYDSIHVYCYLLQKNLILSNYDVKQTVKRYFNSSNDALDEQYYMEVMQWASTLVKVR